MDGIINIYKEKGYTSHDVVAKLRGILKQKKIGHTGTLDPEAEGVLPVCLGSATKLCGLLTDKDKCYEAVLKLGLTTDTQDMTGKVLTESNVVWEDVKIRNVIHSFIGEYDQTPPMYSACKVNGKKLYEYARQGIEVERKKRRITIYSIEILFMNEETKEIHLRVACSKGTYIRTLCHDIGGKLSCGGAMKELKRISAGGFLVEDSITLRKVEDNVREGTIVEKLCPVDGFFLQYPRFYVDKQQEKLLQNGNPLLLSKGTLKGNTDQFAEILVYDTNQCFQAIYQRKPDSPYLKPFKMFLS